MKFQQLTSARTLVLLFLATASISAYQTVDLWSGLKAAKAAEVKARAAEDKSRKQLSKLRLLLGDAEGETAASLLSQVAAISTNARARAVGHGIALGAVAGGQDVEATADTLVGTNLRSVRMSWRGTYSAHQDLLNWLDLMRKDGAALVGLRVTGKEFEAVTRVYGKVEQNG